MLKELFMVLLSCLSCSIAFGQWDNPFDMGKQISKEDNVILTMDNQVDIAESVNKLYNFKFEEAEREFRWYKYKFPNHPIPYFLLGLSEWWKIVPNTDKAMFDSKCLAFMDSCITISEKLYDEKPKFELALLLSSAYAFKGRLYAERKKYFKATAAGKSSLKYLEKCRTYTEFNAEVSFGDGIYNYYAEWIPKEQPILKPIFWLFRSGDKKKGIQQLEQASNYSFWTRTESRYFLLQIYNIENERDKYYRLAKYLHQVYPDNSYFHRSYARAAFGLGHEKEAEEAAQNFLLKMNKKYVGYEAVGARYSTYILGYQAFYYKKDYDLAEKQLLKTVAYAEETGGEKSGYALGAELVLGKIAEQKKEYSKAKDFFKRVKKRADSDSDSHKQALEGLDRLKKVKP